MRTSLPVIALLALSVAALSGCAAVQPYVEQVGNAPSQADDAQAKADLANAKVAYLSFAIENSATPTSSDLAAAGYVQSDGVTAARVLAGSNLSTFCIDLQSAAGTSFKTTASSQVVEGTCSASDL